MVRHWHGTSTLQRLSIENTLSVLVQAFTLAFMQRALMEIQSGTVNHKIFIKRLVHFEFAVFRCPLVVNSIQSKNIAHANKYLRNEERNLVMHFPRVEVRHIPDNQQVNRQSESHEKAKRSKGRHCLA